MSKTVETQQGFQENKAFSESDILTKVFIVPEDQELNNSHLITNGWERDFRKRAEISKKKDL